MVTCFDPYLGHLQVSFLRKIELNAQFVFVSVSFFRLCLSCLPEDGDSIYQYVLRHVADDCLQILFRSLFSCRKEWFEYHSHSRCVVLDQVGDGSARAAISRLDVRNVSNIRPYLWHQLISITKSTAGFLSHQTDSRAPPSLTFPPPCNWTYRVLRTWAAVCALLLSLNFSLCTQPV